MSKHSDDPGAVPKSGPAMSAEGLAAKQARTKRSADALRANLRRRKQQIAARVAGPGEADDEAS